MARVLNTKTKKILAATAALAGRGIYNQAEMIGDIAREWGLLFLYGPYEKHRRDIPTRREMYMAHLRLKRGQYITWHDDGTIAITDKGKLALVVESMAAKRKKDWDGKWRIFIFDVREQARFERNFLRGYLKSFGAKELQKSVWIYPHNIEEEWSEFLQLLNKTIQGDVRMLTVEKISPDHNLKAEFNLR